MDFLTNNGIRFRTTGDGKLVPILVSFSIKEGSPILSQLIRDFRLSPIITPVYSDQELYQAELLWFTPKKQHIEILNTCEAFTYSCRRIDARGISRARHEEQILSLCIQSEPKIGGKTALWASTTGFSEVYADRRLRELVCSYELKHVNFAPIYLPNGSASENLFQLTTDTHVCKEAIVLGNGEREIQCPLCGKSQYAVDRTYQPRLNKRYLDLESDLFITERIFGEGIARPLYFISQRFYRYLKQNGLSANVNFIPVITS